MPSLPDDAESFAQEIKRERVTMSRRIEQVLAPSRLFRRLFTGPDGQMTPDAVAWFDLVGRECFAGRSTYDADARRHAYQQGASDAFNLQLEYGRLDERRLAGLVRQTRELEND